MSDSDIVRRLKEYLQSCPVENGNTYYEYDDGAQSGRNEVKESLKAILDE